MYMGTNQVSTNVRCQIDNIFSPFIIIFEYIYPILYQHCVKKMYFIHAIVKIEYGSNFKDFKISFLKYDCDNSFIKVMKKPHQLFLIAIC